LNNTPGLVGLPIGKPSATAHQYFVEEWLDDIQRLDSLSIGQVMTSFWHTTKSWWDIQELPNLLFLHYANLKADLPGSIRQIASFLDIPIKEDRRQAILGHCSFAYMKANATNSVPLGGAFWDGGAQTFAAGQPTWGQRNPFVRYWRVPRSWRSSPKTMWIVGYG
jgi:aryl sulfotransferase